MRKGKQVLALVAASVMLLSLSACGGSKESEKDPIFSNEGVTDESGSKTWYLGGNNLFAGDVDVEALFDGVPNTVNPETIYDAITYTEDMLHGAYTINNIEEDVVTVRETVPFQEMVFSNQTYSISVVPIGVYLGADNICSSSTNYSYSEFEAITDREVAVLEFATDEKRAQCICVYEVDGNRINFERIRQTSQDEEPFTYELTGVNFSYEFEISGPYLTLKTGSTEMKLTAFCLTDNNDDGLSMYGYSLPDSPLVDGLDYFASADVWNYAVLYDGSYVDISAYKLEDNGRFTLYLAEKSFDGTVIESVSQYAYIMQSSASTFMTDFSVVLFDGEKTYYYTDDIIQREARALEDQGVDVNDMSEEEIKEIAEKKSDLFDDLQEEFESQGINVTINRRTGEIAMDASVLFGGDSAEITDEGKTLLNNFLAVYTSITAKEEYADFIKETVVEGHTAPLEGSTYESGLPLSVERAENVKAYCLSADTGVDTTVLAQALRAQGMSNSKPILGLDGEIDLDACRRVSFRFVVALDNQE